MDIRHNKVTEWFCKNYCNHELMKGFLKCPNEKFEDSHPNNKVPPELGIVFFDHDPHYEQINKSKFNWTRIAVDEGSNFDSACNKARRFRSVGVNVIVCIQNKHNRIQGTIELGVKYAKALGYDFTYECWNEQNSNIAPKSEGWSNYIPPKEYGNLLKRFYDAVKSAVPNCRVIMGGLNGAVDSNSNNKEMVCWEYIDKMGDSIKYTDWWNFHAYAENDIRLFYKTLQKFRSKGNKPVMIGEFNSTKTHTQSKIVEYNKQMEKFTKNKIDIAIYYSWYGHQPYALHDHPGLVEYMKTNWRR